MCWSCDNEQMRLDPKRSFSTMDASSVVKEHSYGGVAYLRMLAVQQRANLETIKQFGSLCDRHIANYELVVQALEKGTNNAKVER